MTLERERVAAALPGYEIGEEVGRGAWGIVLRGQHKRLQRQVAIKQLPTAFAADPAVRRRFDREARLLASLDHPHIVQVFDYVEQEGLCLLVMEFLSGGTLWSRMTSSDIPHESACGVVLATCSALEYAHSKGILHRDIKPENLLFGAPGYLKVTDFGIAKVLGGKETLTSSAGQMLGTPAYVAPEQVLGKEPGPATDVYATGMLLYELLSKQLPFSEEGDVMSLLYRHAHEIPRPILDVAPDLSPAVAEVTMRALRSDPAERYSGAVAFGVSLAQAAEATWGRGWLGRTGLTVMATGAIAAQIAASEERTGVANDRVAVGSGVPSARRAVETLKEDRPPIPSTGRATDRRIIGRRNPLPATEPAPEEVVPLQQAVADAGFDLKPRPRRNWIIPAAGGLVAGMLLVLLALAFMLHWAPFGQASASHGSPIPTASQRPSATRAPGVLVYSDNFTDTRSGWAPDANQAGFGTAVYKPDGYHVVALQPHNPLNTFSVGSPYHAVLRSVAFVGTGTIANGAPVDGWGVRCDQGGRSALRYTFEIHGDGSWVIFKIDSKGASAITQGQSTAVQPAGMQNTVQGQCSEVTGGTDLVMSVNGQRIGQATDPHSGGPILWHGALTVYRAKSSSGTEVVFTRFATYSVA